MKLESFKNSPIKNLGKLYYVQSNSYNGGRVDLVVVPNSHRAISGRDLFKSLG